MAKRRFLLLPVLVLAACGESESGQGGIPDGGSGTGGSHIGAGGSGSEGGASSSGGSSMSGGRPSGAGGGASSGGTAGATGGGGSSAGGGVAGSGGAAVVSLGCEPLPAPTGTTLRVTPGEAGSLSQAVFDAAAGTTILLADGTYPLSATLQLRAVGITLRGESGDSSRVVLDAAYAVNEAIQVSASGVTVAHLTVEHAVDHPIHAFTPSADDVTNLVFYDVHLRDSGEQLLKVNPGGGGGYVDRGRVECSRFTLTDAGRPNVESCCGGCYTGGIDVHAAWGWVVRNNHFEGIYCDGAGLAEHAVHFWKGARDTLVENNVILDCARGIGFGLDGGTGDRVYPDSPAGGANLAHYDGIIRNNVVWANHAYYDTGIELHIASRPKVLHNTVVHGPNASGFFSSIDARFSQTDALLQNNVTQRITQRDSASATLVTNLESAPLSLFVDAAGHDFHLAPGATVVIDQGTPEPESGVDLDGDPHGASPDIGADEHAP